MPAITQVYGIYLNEIIVPKRWRQAVKAEPFAAYAASHFIRRHPSDFSPLTSDSRLPRA